MAYFDTRRRSLPVGGAAPTVIDWGGRGSPASEIPDLGFRLERFAIEHPDPGFLRRLYVEMNIVDPPSICATVRQRYRAIIATPAGRRELQ